MFLVFIFSIFLVKYKKWNSLIYVFLITRLLGILIIEIWIENQRPSHLSPLFEPYNMRQLPSFGCSRGGLICDFISQQIIALFDGKNYCNNYVIIISLFNIFYLFLFFVFYLQIEGQNAASCCCCQRKYAAAATTPQTTTSTTTRKVAQRKVICKNHKTKTTTRDIATGEFI